MRAVPYILLVLCCAGACLTGAGCGKLQQTLDADPQASVQLGDPEPEAGRGRTASSTFTTYFSDTVNDSSWAKWSQADNGGAKQWTLSSGTYQSSPKSFVMGGNYWNNENDYLTSIAFSVPANRQGLRFKFYARWSIAAGDFGYVEYSKTNGASWLPVATFTSGHNPSYPGWDAYSYSITAPGTPSNYKLRYHFTSDAAGTGWGFAVDTVSVYQTNLSAPQNLTASDGTLYDAIQLDWQPPADGTTPSSYYVYRSASEMGTYDFIGSVAWPATTYQDHHDDNAVYWYKVRGYKAGYSYGPFSNANSGYRGAIDPPANVQASDDLYPDRVVVTWNSVIDAMDYTIWRNNVQIGTTSSLTFTDWGLPDFSVYSYQVKAVNSEETSEFSTADDGSELGWQSHEPDNENSSAGGLYTSLTSLTNGHPAIALMSSDNEAGYRHATTSTPSGNPDWTGVSFGSSAGASPCIRLLNNKPAISSTSGSGGVLFSRSIDETPAGNGSWNNIHTIDANGIGQSSHIAIGGFPAVAYCDGASDGLEFALSSTQTPTQTADWAIHQIDAVGDGGMYASMALVASKPAVAYYLAISQDLKYARANAAVPDDGSDWTSMTVDSAASVGTGLSLTVLNGRPAVSYIDKTTGDLKIAIASVSQPSSGTDWAVHVADFNLAANQDIQTFLAIFHNRLAVAYRGDDATGVRLALAKVVNPSSASDWIIHYADGTDYAGYYCSLAIVNGLPAISYGVNNPADVDLKYARGL